MYKLYGDGIHDDYPAIQEMIDSGVCEVVLPAPQKCYMISKTLTLPSYFRLVLPRYAEIKLMAQSNCPMLSNKMTKDYAVRVQSQVSDLCKHLWYHVNEYSPAPEHTSKHIEVEGGIWNFNNMEQRPNPEYLEDFSVYGYTGDGMLFYNATYIKFSNMTLKDPVHYGLTLDRVSYFTCENIDFDYNEGNPVTANMDGIHLDGNCHHGEIRNIKGDVYDDMVAINAHEGSAGDITDILVDGVYCNQCHSAVRLLLVSEVVKNIHITNVYGTFWQYGIGLTKFYPEETTGYFDSITLDNIYAAKAPLHHFYGNWDLAIVWIQGTLPVRNLAISNLHRREYNQNMSTVYVGPDSVVDNMVLDTVTSENYIAQEMPLLRNSGTIRNLYTRNIHTDGDPVISGEGCIENEIKGYN